MYVVDGENGDDGDDDEDDDNGVDDCVIIRMEMLLFHFSLV